MWNFSGRQNMVIKDMNLGISPAGTGSVGLNF